MIAKQTHAEKPARQSPAGGVAEAADGLLSPHLSPSPARVLQETLAARIGDGLTLPDELVERWPRRQRLMFLIGSASALWAVTIGLAWAGATLLG